MSDVLPDVLDFDLDVVFCGTAAGAASAKQGAYYAGPGNRFWPVLAAIGLTDRLLKPEQYFDALRYKIGLTDIVKQASGADRDLRSDDFDADALARKIMRFQPHYLAFNGKRAAQAFLRMRHIDYGLQSWTIGRTGVTVLPSTSGAARAFWDEQPWLHLAMLLGGLHTDAARS